MRAIRSPSEGAILVQGQDRWLPAAWEFTPSGVERLAAYSSAGRRLEGGGVWDVDGLLRLVVALLAVTFGLIAVLDDRMSGWVEAARGLPLPTRLIAASRLIAGFSVLAIVVLIWWLVMSAILLTSQGPNASLLALWSLAPVAVIELFVFFATTTALAIRSRSAFRAISMAVGLWLCGAVLGPSLVVLTGELLIPLPSRPQMESQRREMFADKMRSAENSVARELASTTTTRSEAEVGAATEKEFPRVEPQWQKQVQEVRNDIESIEGAWQGKRAEQQRLITQLSWLFPGALGRDALSELAGTGRVAGEEWNRSVLIQQRVLNGVLFDNRPRVNLRVSINGSEQYLAFDRHPAPRFRDLPQFEPPRLDGRTRLENAQASLIGLAVWTLLAVLVALRPEERP